MKKTFTICLFFLSVASVAYSQCHYRLKVVHFTKPQSYSEMFLLPPGAKIAKEGFIFPKNQLEFQTKSRFQYQSLTISGLNENDFNAVVSNVKKGTYLSKKGTVLGSSPKPSMKGYFKYEISSNHNDLKIEIDMDDFVTNKYFKAGQYDNPYYQLAKDLYETLSGFETSSLNNRNGWSYGVTQSIVEKLFESLPIPQIAVLDQYLYSRTKDCSYNLLDPKIWLFVDDVSKIQPTLDKKFWQMNLDAVSLHKFYRNEDGLIRQIISGNWQDALKTTNYVDNATGTVLVASSGDIQFSSVLNIRPYVGVYNGPLKPNNTVSDNADKYADKFSERNSFMFFNYKFDDAFYASVIDTNPLTNKAIIPAVYGLRNLIVSMIQIKVDHAPEPVQLGSTLGILQQQNEIPDVKGIVVKRHFKDGFKEIANPPSDFIFLPGDEVEY